MHAGKGRESASKPSPPTKTPPHHPHAGTNTFKVLTAAFLILPFIIVVMHFRPGKRQGVVTRSAYAEAPGGAGTEGTATSWAASWPCVMGLPKGALQDVYGVDEDKKSVDLLVYQRPAALPSTLSSSSSPSSRSSFERFILALVRTSARNIMLMPPKINVDTSVCNLVTVYSLSHYLPPPIPHPANPNTKQQGGSSAGFRRTLHPSTLPLGDLLEYIWYAKNKQGGIFKTSVGGAETRHSQGKDSPWAVELFRNPGRASKPSPMQAKQVKMVSLPFDKDKFNFLLASSQDLMFWYRLPQEEEGASSSSSSSSSNKMTTTQCQPVEQEDIARRRVAQQQQHGVFINPYPIGDLSGVLCPFLFEKRPQVLSGSLHALTVGLTFAAELRASNENTNDQMQIKKTNLRLGFNSLGAGASIGHLHFQFWSYNDGPDGLIPIERAPLRQPMLTSFPGVELSVIDKGHHPIRSMALSGASMPTLAKAGAHCINVLVARNIPFSLLMNGKHLYIMPRRFSDVTFNWGSVGFPEAAGLLLVVNETYWRDATLLNADVVWELWDKTYDISEEVFKEVVEECAVGPAAGVDS